MKSEAGLGALLRLYWDIARWQRGPADVPASGLLLGLTLALYALVNALCLLALDGISGRRLPELAFDVSFGLIWYGLLLWSCGWRARLLQTMSALFGFQTLLAPALVLSAMALAAGGRVLPWGGLGAALLLLTWTGIATAHILRDALQWRLGACAALAFLQIIVEEVLLANWFGTGS